MLQQMTQIQIEKVSENLIAVAHSLNLGLFQDQYLKLRHSSLKYCIRYQQECDASIWCQIIY